VNHYVAGDASGAPHLVVVNWDHTLAHMARTGSGWSSEAIPAAGSVNVLWGDFDTFRVLGGGEGPAVVYQDGRSLGSTGAVYAIVRGSAGWTPPVAISPTSSLSSMAGMRRGRRTGRASPSQPSSPTPSTARVGCGSARRGAR
jgi:hypothetical protein